MDDIVMRVNGVSTHSVSVPVTYQGEEASAMMPELAVELHDEDGQHGSITLHFRKTAEVAAAKDLFQAGGNVKMSFSKGDDVPTSINTDLSDQPQGEPAPEQQPQQ